mmetsp:Transcript_1177/g.4101  ORF Transcript_1177/g.4101 Transcript_1177/m.4101 type:complete len:156 (+) Transcript_1177:160-627(+)
MKYLHVCPPCRSALDEYRAAYTAAGRSSIEYWAAGVNCCGDGDGRTFTCDDIRNKQAHAGLVFLDYGPRRKLLETFVKAAKEAGTTHGMEPAQDAMFVMWVVDPDDAQHWYWHAGTSFLAGGTIVYLAFSIVIGVMMHFGPADRGGKQKLGSRIL